MWNICLTWYDDVVIPERIFIVSINPSSFKSNGLCLLRDDLVMGPFCCLGKTSSSESGDVKLNVLLEYGECGVP